MNVHSLSNGPVFTTQSAAQGAARSPSQLDPAVASSVAGQIAKLKPLRSARKARIAPFPKCFGSFLRIEPEARKLIGFSYFGSFTFKTPPTHNFV
jgi:hypothetical protein